MMCPPWDMAMEVVKLRNRFRSVLEDDQKAIPLMPGSLFNMSLVVIHQIVTKLPCGSIDVSPRLSTWNHIFYF